MTTSNNTSASNLNVVEKSVTANLAKLVKTQRVLEDKELWARIFGHMATLVATLAIGEPLPEDPRKGFGFAKMAEQPHSRDYARALLCGFISRKAGKVFEQTVGLKEAEDRMEIAIAILDSCKLALKGDAKATLTKGEAKQAKTCAMCVLDEIQKAKKSEPSPKEKKAETKEPSPKEKKTAAKATSPTEKKTRKPSTRKAEK